MQSPRDMEVSLADIGLPEYSTVLQGWMLAGPDVTRLLGALQRKINSKIPRLLWK